ncbi:MAG: helix-turn-helix domain-containing protein [Rhodospirillales bacterium]|nr:helix-turn-helix domain-containing protein [Rhodospirillales bacterium]
MDKSNIWNAAMPEDQVPAFWLYGERRNDRFPDALHIETIATRSLMHDWTIRPHRHQEMFQFLLIESGGGHTRIDGQSGSLGSGSVILLPPLAVHEFDFTAGTNGFVASIAITSIRRLLHAEPGAEALLSQPMLLQFQRSDAKLRSIGYLMRSAHDEFSARRIGRDSALSAHAELISLWFARTSQSRASLREDKRHPRIDLVRRFIEMVEVNFRSGMSLSDYAQGLGVSVPHLTRVCRQVVDRPAVGIIQDRLMIEARRDLVYTAMPISQIAFRLGFSDPAYFSRFFAIHAGVSPSAYRGKR